MTTKRLAIRGVRGRARHGSRGPHPGATMLALGILLGAGGTAVSAPPAIDVGFQDSMLTVAPGHAFNALITVRAGSAPFNAFDASVRYDPAMLQFEPLARAADQVGDAMASACGNTFHRFNATPDSLKVTLSLLCNKMSLEGPATVYRAQFRAGHTPGTTTIALGPSTEFYHAGLFVRPLQRRAMAVTIGDLRHRQETSAARDSSPHARPLPGVR